MTEEHINEIKAILVLALGMILLASLISFVPEDLPWFTSQPNVPAQNLISRSGAYVAGFLFLIFGNSSYGLIVFLFFWSWNKFSSRDIAFSFVKFMSVILLFAVLSALFSLIGNPESALRFDRGGMIGLLGSDVLVQYVGHTGAYILLLTLGILSLIVSGEFLVSPLFLRGFEGITEWFVASKDKVSSIHKAEKALTKKEKKKPARKPRIVKNEEKEEPEEEWEDEDEEYEYEWVEEEVEGDEEDPEEESAEPQLEPKIKVVKGELDKSDSADEEKVVGVYHLPPMDLLEDPPKVDTSNIESGLLEGAKLLEQTLSNFGVDAHVADIERGPAITRYELEPAPGVKVQKFTTLTDDIALAMKATAVRIVAPIPGKNRVGIEVPNGSSAAVFLKDVLVTNQFQKSQSKLSLGLGKDIAGKPMIGDLADMPHLLIAGTTGSGKTVCVNAIIMSILMSVSPDEVKFVMVDPKMVEMTQYQDIPHLLCPPVTDAQKASNVLNWVVSEMESRYKKLSKVKARNISSYNAKGNKMPYIVVIVDELADLMQVSAKTVESSIMRLAQMSRAVGIHLILATQRPSVNVITGVIKANFPARISFKVASKMDSRTVLDMNGAESLLGKGDMLFLKPGDAKPTRGQCSFLDDDEINRVIQFIKDQQSPTYDETILNQQKVTGRMGGGEKDEYYDEAVRLIVETNQASVSILQRRMRLGYTRAARLIDMMEQNGIVGPYCGSKPRELLVDREEWLLENSADGDDGE